MVHGFGINTYIWVQQQRKNVFSVVSRHAGSGFIPTVLLHLPLRRLPPSEHSAGWRIDTRISAELHSAVGTGGQLCEAVIHSQVYNVTVNVFTGIT